MSTLDNVLSVGSDYLDSDVACEALAAAEVVARLRGNWGVRDSYTEAIDAWVEAHPGEPSPDLIARAVAAINRIVTEPSELLELWSESEDDSNWRQSVEELKKRVAG